MSTPYAVTLDDVQQALLRGADLAELEGLTVRQLRLPPREQTGADPLCLLRRTSPELAEMVAGWMQGVAQPVKRPGTLRGIVALPFCPQGTVSAAYVKRAVQKYQPSVIAVEATPGEIGAAFHYACSVCCGVCLSAVVRLVHDGCVMEQMRFFPDDFLPALALYCFQKKIALVPLSQVREPVASEFQLHFHMLLEQACREFSRACPVGATAGQLEALAVRSMQHLYSAGVNLTGEREASIARSCYTASRLHDLSRCPGAGKGKQAPVLALYQLQHALDVPGLITAFRSSPGTLTEMYSHLEPIPAGSFELQPIEDAARAGDATAPTAPAGTMARRIQKILDGRMQQRISPAEADDLTAHIAAALRMHPRVERPPGVRGTLATREIAQAWALMKGGLTREVLARAAWIALRHRTRIYPGEGLSEAEIFKSVFSRILAGIALDSSERERTAAPGRPMTPEELAQALLGLNDAALRTREPGEALPLSDPAFAEEAMKHPLVQQALKDAADKGTFDSMQDAYSDLLNNLEDRDMLTRIDASHMALTEDGHNRIKEHLEEALQRREISPEELAEALKRSSAMSAPPGFAGDSIKLPPRKEAELLTEMMDFQHQGKSESASLEDLYVHYALNEKKGIKVSGEKVDYEKLRIILHQLEQKGLVSVSREKKRFTLTSRALSTLLKMLVRSRESQMLERRAFRREHETDKSDVRRYRRGDAFRDLSLRHTLRRLLRKGKTLAEINYTDLRCFEKKPVRQLDIAVCVDISASMKERAKLRYAKMALAELARAAVEKHDRMGIIAFSNLGEEVVRLTDKLPLLLEASMTLRADQYTNIGNGLHRARRMLLREHNSNQKHIILITDGQPNAALDDDTRQGDYYQQVAAFSRQTSMETKKAVGTRHAVSEAQKTSREHIKISVVYISPEGEEDQESERTAREIARIGNGRFHLVRSIERLPVEALETVG